MFCCIVPNEFETVFGGLSLKCDSMCVSSSGDMIPDYAMNMSAADSFRVLSSQKLTGDLNTGMLAN